MAKRSTKSANGATTTNRIAAQPKEVVAQIQPPNLRVATFKITGITPYMQNKFSTRAKRAIRDQQEAGGTAKSKKKREPKDFKKCCEEATHVSSDGWVGIPAPSFRAAMISACRVAGFVMTRAKLAIRILEDGFDAEDFTPLVKINGKPEMDVRSVRPQKGTMDLAARPRWDEGWTAHLNVEFDADLFALEDVYNLLSRAGLQVGIGCGRPDSSDSCGMGFGLFSVEGLTDQGI